MPALLILDGTAVLELHTDYNTRIMKIKLYLLLFLLFLIAGCEREQTLPLPESTLEVVQYDGNPIIQEPRGDVELDIVAQSLSGIDRVEVLVDGEVVETASPTTDLFTYNYMYVYRVSENAQMGDEITILFRMTDKDGRIIESDNVIIRVDQPFVISEFVQGAHTFNRVKGRINRDVTFTKDRMWLVDSLVSVTDGRTLTIEAGATVYFRTSNDAGRTSRLVIARDSRIVANGTREEPVVFTSDRVLTGNAARGDWGGISLFGGAPTNAGGNVLLDGFRYGGSSNADNSGVLRFARVEYSGKDGFHSLGLYGVGSGTRVEYVESYESYNNALRIRGGRVSLKYFAGIQHGGYGVWADEGWQGNGQFWVFQTDIAATLIPVNYWNQARSIELRNDESLFEKQPRTTFRISNVTLIGNGFEEDVDFGTRRGVRIRRGAQGFLHNTIVTEFPNDAVRVEDLPTESLGVSTIIDNMHVFRNLTNWGQEAEDVFFESGDYNLLEMPVEGISRTSFLGTAPSPFNPSSMGSWFSSAPYIGAVDPSNDWTKGGAWFKNMDGSLRE